MSKNFMISVLLDFYGDMLTEKQREVIDLYYNQDLSLGEIAQSAEITRQGVRDSIKRGESILLEMEERLHLAQRFREMQTGLDMIIRLAGEIRNYSEKHVYSQQIVALADRISAVAEKLGEST